MVFIIPTPAIAEAPADGNGWFQQAQAARQAERFDEAFNALEQAEKLEFSPLRINFERARLYRLGDDQGKAVAELEAIAASGFTAVGFIVNDPILSTLQGNGDYDAIVADMTTKAYPCENDESFRAFDFWVGHWEVHGPNGGFAGTNTIERAERGCVLIENWTSVSGGTGMSINYLDKTTGEWVQVWNAEGGSQIHIRGGMTAEGMMLVGTLHRVGADTTTPFRGLWTPLPDGRVRQLFEQSSDSGEAWTTWFDGYYTRKD